MTNDDKWWPRSYWWQMMLNDDKWWQMMINDDQDHIDDNWWSMMINDDKWW